MPNYLVKYIPLCSTTNGLRASARFRLPPYVDGSCRREPDFECEFPSISAICRGKLFAPRLQEGDEVVYITTKGLYGEAVEHSRIVSRLKVIKRFSSHRDAATWYRGKIGRVPSNCMVPGNPPLPLSHTTRGSGHCAPGCGSAAASLKKWNQRYQVRADTIPVFLACEIVWKELTSPTILTDKQIFKILKNWKRVRSRLPIKINGDELKAFERVRK